MKLFKNLLVTKEDDTDIFEKNEKDSVHFLGLIGILFSFVEILAILCDVVRAAKLFPSNYVYPVAIVALANIFVTILIWLIPKYYKLTKYLIIFTLLINSGLMDFLLSYYSLMILILPLLVSSRFYDKKLTISLIILTIVITLINSFGCWSLVTNGITPIEYFDINIKWDDLSDVILKNFALKNLTLLVIYIISFYMTISGKRLIKEQAKISKEVAVIENELKTASDIQKQVLPFDFDAMKLYNVDLFASMKPAKEVAGDFYDCFNINNTPFFLIGDVSDKGLSAAMFMMNIKNTIHAIALSRNHLSDTINLTNKTICKGNDSLMYVTLWIGYINTKKNELHFINAGHPNAYIKKKNGEVSQIIPAEPQPFIGTFPNYMYKETVISIEPGDSLFLYTDGVTDSLNEFNNQYNYEGIQNVLRKNSNSPKETLQMMTDDIQNFVGSAEQFDDITMMSVFYNKFDYDEEFECDLNNIQKVIYQLDEDLIKNNCNKDSINIINSAIDDLLDNIISYAYEDKSNSFRVQYYIRENQLKLVVSDSGVSFNPLKIKEADLSPDRQIGGLGIYLIRNIMDNVEYIRDENKNILILTKNF